jgi:hypothetical protein
MTRLFDVMNGLVMVLRSASGLSAPDGNGVPVYDGPVSTHDAPKVYVVVGGDNIGDEAEDAAITIEHDEISIPRTQPGTREERLSVPIAIWATDGDNDYAAARDLVESVWNAIDNALRAVPDPLALPGLQRLGLGIGSLQQFTDSSGVRVAMPVTLDAVYRI